MWAFEVLSFDLEQGRQLTSTDIFPEPEKSIRPYWEFIREAWKGQNDSFFLCHNFEELTQNKDFMFDRLILNKQGATFLVGPYGSCGGFGTGNQVVDIPNNKMIEFGADPNIWE